MTTLDEGPNGPSAVPVGPPTIEPMTNTETRDAWREVGDRLEALALKLKLHAEEELSDDGRAVKGALQQLRSAVDDTVAAVSDACHDPAVKSDARDAVDALARAISKTVDRT